MTAPVVFRAEKAAPVGAVTWKDYAVILSCCYFVLLPVSRDTARIDSGSTAFVLFPTGVGTVRTPGHPENRKRTSQRICPLCPDGRPPTHWPSRLNLPTLPLRALRESGL
jgi:hypothetical protein